MKAPWIEFPELWPTSNNWKSGSGAVYLAHWKVYFEKLTEEEQKQYKLNNKAPFYWFYFYWMQNQNLVSWFILFTFLMFLTWPFRKFHFNKMQNQK